MAPTLRVSVHAFPVERPGELQGAFAAMARERTGALIVQPGQLTVSHHARIVTLAATHRLPAMYEAPHFVRSGGLMSYGANLFEVWRRLATYVDKILKGAKPADLPVEQPTKFEFAINLRTARALRLTIPPSILARATEVIE